MRARCPGPIVVAFASLITTATQAETRLEVLARVGPWPVVSQLIGYDGRVWFANSVKGRNHNSADIYSYGPPGGELRYERHLFSQDAGKPVVADGLLYWPFEDSRFSLGWGHFMVTNGRDWRYGAIPTALSFHTHAMAAAGGRLVAATSAWRAGLQVSDDAGTTWRQVYDHPTANRRLSRIYEMAALGSVLFAPLVDRSSSPPVRRLLRFASDDVGDVPGWPVQRIVLGMASFDAWLYAAIWDDDGAAIWRTDGRMSERITEPRAGWRVRDLAAGPDGLWVLEAAGNGGRLWFSADGRTWRISRTIDGGQPQDLLVYGGAAYVGGAGDDGQGILWGDAAPLAVPAAALKPLPPIPAGRPRDWPALAAELDALLARPDSYDRHGRVLRDALYRAVISSPPPGWLAARLSAAMPDRRLSLIGGAVTVPAHKLGQWAVLWAMALARQGSVPVDLIAAPWTAPDNGSEKYFEPAPAAIWAAAMAGQDDPDTIASLIDRLDRPGDPLWLRGDVVGALTALTGQRFGYDIAAWRRWQTR